LIASTSRSPSSDRVDYKSANVVNPACAIADPTARQEKPH